MARPVVDVRTFGARGDGVSDDRDAIVRALYREFVPSERFVRRVRRFDRGGGVVLHFPAGRYRIAGPLERLFDLDHLAIVGDGQGVTTLVFDHRRGRADPGRPPHFGALPRLSVGGHPGGAVTGFTLEGVTLTTDRPAPTPPNRDLGAAPLSVGWCRGVRIRDVEIADAHNTGVYLYHCEEVLIEGCHVHHVNLDGVQVSRSRGVTVRGCRIHDTGDDGVGVSGTPVRPSQDVVLADNDIRHAGSNGISLFGVEGAEVLDNRVVGTYMCGITVRPWPGCCGTRDVIIAGNTVGDAGLYPADDQIPEVPLWGGGAPAGIAVANDTGTGAQPFVDVDLGPVVIRDNTVGPCRNNFVVVRLGRDVVVEGNDFQGPLVTGARGHDDGVDGRSEGSGTFDPPAPYDGPEAGGGIAVWVRDSDRTLVGSNTVAAGATDPAVPVVLREDGRGSSEVLPGEPTAC